MNNIDNIEIVPINLKEKYFKQWNYPYEEEHLKEHEKLIFKVLKFQNKFDSGEKIMKELVEFLKDWLENHLMIYDMKYAKYFKENVNV